MSHIPETAPHHGKGQHRIEVADETLTYQAIHISDPTPTGAQLARAAGFKDPNEAIVLHVLKDGALETVRPEEVIDLHHHDGRFVVVASDRIYLLTVDGQRFDWPCGIVSGRLIRKLASIPEEKALYLERVNQPDRLIGACELVDLNSNGIESFITRNKAGWKLNVHGVVIEVATPTITVSAAMEQAGFDTGRPWHIFLKVVGETKRQVSLTDVLDLQKAGIEKLRLTPCDIDNGDSCPAPRRDFGLLDIDNAYLDRLKLGWETILDAERRWLLIHNFPIPPGYTVTHTLMALEIPPTYPGAQIYGFYAYPPLALASSRTIPRTQLRGTLLGLEFHGWSRYRGQNAPWDPLTDNVVTQIGLVEAALTKETEK